MSLRVIGINHKTAPVAIREKVAFTPEGLNNTLLQIKNDTADTSTEVIILSTCNRTEIYTFSDAKIDHIIGWLTQQNTEAAEQIEKCVYDFSEKKAIQHVMRVASGLDSMVLGEPQILGQLKTALKIATKHDTAGTTLKRLMQHAFSTAKKVRTETSIGSNPVSVAFAAVNLAKQIFSKFENKTALLIGAGETIELVGKHLSNAKIGNIIIANRSVENANRLAKKLGGQGISLQQIGDYLADADIVISSTAAPVPIIGKGTVERALKQRKHKPVFMVDIAVPRDIEEEVGELDDIYLYTVDDLKSVIDENIKSREKAAEQGEAMVIEHVETFMGWLRAQDQMELIRSYRSKINNIQNQTLEKAQKLLRNGTSADEVLVFLAHTLTNKLAHDATVSMNKAAQSGDHRLLEASDRILNLSQDLSENSQNTKDKK